MSEPYPNNDRQAANSESLSDDEHLRRLASNDFNEWFDEFDVLMNSIGTSEQGHRSERVQGEPRADEETSREEEPPK